MDRIEQMLQDVEAAVATIQAERKKIEDKRKSLRMLAKSDGLTASQTKRMHSAIGESRGRKAKKKPTTRATAAGAGGSQAKRQEEPVPALMQQ
jgi:CRISPR/Cas system CSM-associated protein Csm2 small subunit